MLDGVLSAFREKFLSNTVSLTIPLEIDEDKFNIAIHCRRGDLLRRDGVFKRRAYSDEYYLDAIEYVKSTLLPEGKQVQFTMLTEDAYFLAEDNVEERTRNVIEGIEEEEAEQEYYYESQQEQQNEYDHTNQQQAPVVVSEVVTPLPLKQTKKNRSWRPLPTQPKPRPLPSMPRPLPPLSKGTKSAGQLPTADPPMANSNKCTRDALTRINAFLICCA